MYRAIHFQVMFWYYYTVAQNLCSTTRRTERKTQKLSQENMTWTSSNYCSTYAMRLKSPSFNAEDRVPAVIVVVLYNMMQKKIGNSQKYNLVTRTLEINLTRPVYSNTTCETTIFRYVTTICTGNEKERAKPRTFPDSESWWSKWKDKDRPFTAFFTDMYR